MHCRKLYMLYTDLEENLDSLIPVGSIKNEVLKGSAKTNDTIDDPLQEDRT